MINARIAAILLLLAAPAAGQNRPLPTVELSAGWVGFADDGVVTEFPAGAAVRWHLSPRVSVGPEVTWIAGESHSHQVVTGNLTFDILAPRGSGPRATPFVVIGGGLFRTSESFANDSFDSSEGAFTVGGGVRAPLTDRVTLGIDARLGWEPHLRITGVVGVRLGR